ncbi:MAG: SDR family oxidoreductase [Candidatus Omnitrophica bacterium]|nr:SDR family oxidoreductase [Candidatus Omnitrophota bacterium]
MNPNPVILITGTRKGIGRYLVDYYLKKDFQVIGCSRSESDCKHSNYWHFCADVADEKTVEKYFSEIDERFGGLDILVNNAGIASMNHMLLTPLKTLKNIYETNVFGTFLFCREAAKLMQKKKRGRIINFATVATPLDLEGEAAYASSKAAVESLTRIFAKELAPFGITVNAVGPTPIKTDLIRSVPEEKMKALLQRQAIRRYGEFKDVAHVLDFFIQKESDFVTGQVVYLGGIS